MTKENLMNNFESEVERFMKTFNTGDFDGMLATFSQDGVYIDPHGTEHRGASAISTALGPIFQGALGSVRYEVTSTLLDEAQSRALVTWTLVMTSADGTKSALDGLDILAYRDGKLESKNAFCKATDLAIRSRA